MEKSQEVHTYTQCIDFYKDDFYQEQKCKVLYEKSIKSLLCYYGQIGKCSIGYSLIINQRLIHQVISLSDLTNEQVLEINDLREKSRDFLPTSFWDACQVFLSLIEKHRYANTVRKTSLHTLSLLFLFLDMHNLGYMPRIAWIWFCEVKYLLKSNWAMSRRVLKLFEHFIHEGNITPKTTFIYKPTHFDLLPN